MESLIRWKKGDYIRLGQAVAFFNKTINQHKTLENQMYLPETLNYQDIKQKIVSRKELNTIINSLRNINKPDAFNIVILDSGEKLINWEFKDLTRRQALVINRLEKDLIPYITPNEQGYTRVQMGSSEFRKIQARLEDFSNLQFRVGEDFKTLRRKLYNVGTTDYMLRKAITYRENYLKVLQRYSHLDNYDILMKELNKHRNPLEFYNFMKNAGEIIVDLTVISEQHFQQEAFNSFIEDLGIEIIFDSVS